MVDSKHLLKFFKKIFFWHVHQVIHWAHKFGIKSSNSPIAISYKRPASSTWFIRTPPLLNCHTPNYLIITFIYLHHFQSLATAGKERQKKNITLSVVSIFWFYQFVHYLSFPRQFHHHPHLKHNAMLYHIFSWLLFFFNKRQTHWCEQKGWYTKTTQKYVFLSKETFSKKILTDKFIYIAD